MTGLLPRLALVVVVALAFGGYALAYGGGSYGGDNGGSGVPDALYSANADTRFTTASNAHDVEVLNLAGQVVFRVDRGTSGTYLYEDGSQFLTIDEDGANGADLHAPNGTMILDGTGSTALVLRSGGNNVIQLRSPGVWSETIAPESDLGHDLGQTTRRWDEYIGGLQRVTGTAPAEPYACGATTVGHPVYVDDTNDAAQAVLCVCIDTNDGTIFDWRRLDDNATACPFF